MTRESEGTADSRTIEALPSLLQYLRREGQPAHLVGTGLDAVLQALGADGAAVIRALAGSVADAPLIVHRAGIIGPPDTTACALLWQAEVGEPALSQELSGRPIAVAVCRDSVGERLGLAVWRKLDARTWSDSDGPLLDSIAGVVWLLLDRRSNSEHGFAGAARTDPLTALLNRRAFVAEATRHIVRLDRDQLPGTLMLAEVDNLENVSLLLGPDGADRVLRRAAVLLQSTVRPTDLVGPYRRCGIRGLARRNRSYDRRRARRKSVPGGARKDRRAKPRQSAGRQLLDRHRHASAGRKLRRPRTSGQPGHARSEARRRRVLAGIASPAGLTAARLRSR